MQFYNWRTDYDGYRAWSERNKQKPKTLRSFYEERLEQFIRYKMPPWRLNAETAWIPAGRPYYNIHPKLVSKLTRINLEKIPANLIELPNRLPAVNIRFAQQHPELTIHEGLHTANMLNQSQEVPAGSFAHSLLFADMRADGVDQVYFIIDFDIYQQFAGYDHKQPCYGVFPLHLDGNKSVAEAVEETARSSIGSGPDYVAVAANCLRLAITIGFMANSSSELIEPDVLSKLRNDFDLGDEGRRNMIVEKSRRKGKIGWNVGNDLMFLGHQPVRGGHSSEQTGRELDWAHIREGHPRAVRYGPKHQLVKIMWIRPTVVRPDLPFKPS